MFIDLEGTIDPNCINPTEPKVDNTSIECDEIISTNCVVTAKGYPYLGVGYQETLTSVLEKIKEKFKSIFFTILNLGTGIGLLKSFSGGVLSAKSIQAGNNIVLTDANDTITISTTGGVIIDITHANLLASKNASTLSPETYYRITDFRTMYDQPDYTILKAPKTSVAAKQGPVEPIIVFALKNNSISIKAQQEAYPKDTIEYMLEFTTPVNNTVTKGRIIYRKDEWGNETDFDHRNILFKRYNDPYSSNPLIFFDNGNTSSEFKIFTYVATDESSNNKVLGYFSNPDRGVFDLPNIVMSGKASNNYFSNASYNLTLYSSSIKDNTFTGISGNSFISSTLISKNNLGNFFNNSFYSLDFYSNYIDNCSSNIFDSSYFTSNKIVTMNENTIEGDFEGNTGVYFADNLIKGFSSSYFQAIDTCACTSDVTKLLSNCNIVSVNFSTATKIYKIESKEIHLAEGNNYFISYLDQFGARVVNGILA